MIRIDYYAKTDKTIVFVCGHALHPDESSYMVACDIAEKMNQTVITTRVFDGVNLVPCTTVFYLKVKETKTVAALKVMLLDPLIAADPKSIVQGMNAVKDVDPEFSVPLNIVKEKVENWCKGKGVEFVGLDTRMLW